MKRFTAPELSIEIIPKQLAINAFTGTSHSPEERARQTALEFCMAMEQDWIQISSWDNDESNVDGHFKDHLQYCLELYSAWLTARSSCISTLIAGPSNFPVSRAQKANKSETNKFSAFKGGRAKSLKRIKKEILPYGDGSVILSDDPDAIDKLSKKLDQLKKSHDIMKNTNKILRSKTNIKERLKALGLSDNNIIEIQKPDDAGRIGFASYALSLNLSEIGRIEKRIEDINKRKIMTECGPYIFNGGKVIIDKEAFRLRIVFEVKPTEEKRKLLKSKGYKWSPRAGAWQRKLTNNSVSVTEQVLNICLEEAYI